MKTLESTQKFSRLLLILALAAALAVAYGCGKRGNGEKAGEKVDNALHDTKDNVKDVFDKDGPAENAGEKVDHALDK